MSQEGGRSKIVAPTLDKDLSTSSVPDASDLSSLDTQGEDQDIALVEVQGPHPLRVLSESSQTVVPGQEVEEPDHQPETSANLPPDPLPKERPQRSVRPNPEHVQEHGPLQVSSYTKTAGNLSIFLNQATQELDRGLSSPIRTDELFIELEAHYQDLVERFHAVRELRLDLEYQASYESLVDRCNSVWRQLRSVNPPTSTSSQQDDFKHAVSASVKHEPQDTHAESPNAQFMPHTASTSSVKAVQLIEQRQIDEIKRSVKSRAKGHHSQKSGSCSARSSSSTSSKKLIKRSEAAALKLRQQAMPDLEQHEKAELDMQRKIEEEEMLLRAELDHLEAQQKADKAQAEAQRKVEEAQQKADKAQAEAQRKVEEAQQKADKARAEAQRKVEEAQQKADKAQAEAQRKVEEAQQKADKARAEAQRKVEEAQQKADKARAEAQRKVEEAQEEAQGKAEEFKLRIEKTRKLNEMKDRLARIKTEKEHAKLQVDIKAAEVAAAILEAGSEVDDASMVLSSLAPLNRTRDLFLNRTYEVFSKPSNAVGTAQATSQPSASRIHKDHLKLTSHPLRYSNPAPNLHSQANMSIGNRQSCVKQDCELTTQSLNLQSNLHRLMKPVHHSHQDGSREVPLSTGPCQQLLFPKYSTFRVVDSIFDNTGEREDKAPLEPAVAFPGTKKSATPYGVGKTTHPVSESVNPTLAGDPQQYNGTTHYHGSPPYGYWDNAQCDQHLSAQAPPFVPTNSNISYSDQKATFETFVDFLHFESNALQHVPFLRPRKPGNPDTPIDKVGRSNKTFLTNSGPGADQSEIASLEDETNAGEPPSQTGKRNPTCLFCKNAHYVPECKKFAAIPYMKRKEFVMKQRLCFKCLRPFHRARDCKKTVTCNECKGNHITSMHDPDFKPRSKQPPGNDQQPEQNVSTNVNSAASVGKHARREQSKRSWCHRHQSRKIWRSSKSSLACKHSIFLFLKDRLTMNCVDLTSSQITKVSCE
ncbi:hypothetical protein ACOMHN_002999 [Nucella lapillus]